MWRTVFTCALGLLMVVLVIGGRHHCLAGTSCNVMEKLPHKDRAMPIFSGIFLLDTLGVITGLLAIIIVYFKWAFQYWKRRGVNYLEPSIPFGNFPSPFKSSAILGSDVPNMYQEAKSKGWKYVGIYFMVRPTFMVIDLDLLKTIFIKDSHHFINRGFYSNEKDDPISAHLFSLDGQRWKNARAKISPTFTSSKLKMMFQTVLDSGNTLEKYLETVAENKEPVDIKDILISYTLDVIGSCGFGLNINSFKTTHSPLKYYSRKFLTPTKIASFKNLFGQSFPDLAQALKVSVVPKDVSDFFTKLVEDTVNHREKNNISRKDFLQLLIDIKNNKDVQENDGKSLDTITMTEIVAQSFVFFLAGFETTSTTVSFSVFELCSHPEIQEKLRNEIKTVLAKHDGQITYDSLSEMKYMDQVISETLRVHTPLAFLTRVVDIDYKLPDENTILEKGTLLLIPAQAYHQDPEYFPNPDVFNPEQFSEENKMKRPQFAHIPFGGGPRVCIGERFGKIETKIALISILRNFRVTLNKKTEVPLKLATNTLVPTAAGGIWVDMEKV